MFRMLIVQKCGICGAKWSIVGEAGTKERKGAGMFLGTYEPRLDDKGRLILPAKFRDQLASGVVVTRGQERCLYVFPRAEFENIHEQLAKAPLTSKQVRDYTRVLLSGASDEIPDKQGRITLPQTLRSYAGLGRELTVIGSGSKVEIWDTNAWQTYLDATEDLYSDLTEEVFPPL